jgi:signal peptidase I
MKASLDREAPDPITKAALAAWIQSGRPCRVPVSGMSMYPLLRRGRRVALGPVSGGIGYGDVVVYFLGEKLVVHRVVGIKEGPEGRIFQTKGDSSLLLDAYPLPEGEVLGKVIAVEMGRETIRLQSRAWRAAGCLIAGCSYCLGAVGSWMRRRMRTPHRAA